MSESRAGMEGGKRKVWFRLRPLTVVGNVGKYRIIYSNI